MMKAILLIFSLFFMTCCTASKLPFSSIDNGDEEIIFEVLQQTKANLIDGEFVILHNQQQIDEAYQKIFDKMVGNRYPPIPILESNNLYCIIKIQHKDYNDIVISNANIDNETLIIKAEGYNSPEINVNTKKENFVILRLQTQQNIKKIKINY